MSARVVLSALSIFVAFIEVVSCEERSLLRYERAAAATTTPKPVMCIHCTDLACFTSPVSSACSSTTETYCISTVTDHSSGTRDIAKGCATLAQCVEAYNTTKLDMRCQGIDHQVTGFDFTCSFCCKGDNCNMGPQLKPSHGQQFAGKAIVGK